LLSLTTVIRSEKVGETVSFYSTVLGFTVAEKNDDWNWVSLYRDKGEIMISKPNFHAEFSKPVFTGSFYFRMDKVMQLWIELKDKVRTCYPLESFNRGMREFAIYDNNGYIL
jgi:hypothetical protein